MKRLTASVVAGCLLLPVLFLAAQPFNVLVGPGPASERLQLEYRDVEILREDSRISSFSGPMVTGDTPELAAETWLELWGQAIGVTPPELTETRHHALANGRLTIFAYSQSLGGIPVEGSAVHVVVRNTDGVQPNQVVHVGAKVTQTPSSGFAPIDPEPERWFDSLRASQSFGSLSVWKGPELVVLDSSGDLDLEEPRLAWKSLAHGEDPANFEAYTLFVDAATGDLLHVRDEVYHLDIQGKVTGKGSPGTYPDTGANAVSYELSEAAVGVVGGNSAKTDSAGDFVISHSGSSPVTVATDLTSDWVRVLNTSGSELALSQSVTPPGPADFAFNDTPSEATTAQVNGFIHAVATHEFYKSRNPAFTGLDIQIPCNVNIGSNCNAYYTTADHSINFYSSGGGCVNTAYSSVVAHEYGHFIVNRLGLSQGAFGEGFGDIIGMLLYDDPIVGRDFVGPGSYVRDTVSANVQYPCSGQIHYCGQLLSGVWWDLRDNLVASLGQEAGLSMAQQLLIDWSAITIGGSGTNSAHPTTAVEVLTVDDDDGDLSNGTPHYAEICAAFEAHSIDCPDLAAVLFSYPDGVPSTVVPGVETEFRVHIEAQHGEPVDDSAYLVLRVNGGDFTEIPLTSTASHEYTAVIGSLECFDLAEFYVTVDLVGGGTASEPDDAPTTLRSSRALTGEALLFHDDFEDDLGWTVVNDSITGGVWEAGIPAGDGSRGDPVTDYDGSGRCFLTENLMGNSDVDGGPTRLVSPTLDFSSGDGTIRYAYWMYNDDGDDSLEVLLSDDDGATWTVAASHTGGNGGWETNSITIADWVLPTSTVVVGFSIADSPNNSITEAAIDAFVATALTCDGFVDCNGNGIPDGEDIGSGESFDCNDNGIPDECDIEAGTSLDTNGNGTPDECEDFIAFCGVPSVNGGCGAVEDVLWINGSSGGPERIIEVGTTTLVSMTVQEPSSRVGDGKVTRMCLYLWSSEPIDKDLVALPKSLGTMCFGPYYLATEEPEIVLNSLGADKKLGQHNGAGNPPVLQDGATLEFLAWPDGFGSQQTFTVQGVIQDDCSPGQKRFAVTNGIVIRIE